MKALEFKEYKAPYEDGDGDEHESVIRAAVVGKDDVHYEDGEGNRKTREVVTPTGSRKVQEGDVFVETGTPGVYDYLSAEAWKSVAYSGAAKKSDDEDKQPAKKAATSSGQR